MLHIFNFFFSVVTVVDPDGDLMLQMSGEYEFDQTTKFVTQSLVMAVANDGIEDCECFTATISAIGSSGTTAAEALGDISTTEICVFDTDVESE